MSKSLRNTNKLIWAQQPKNWTGAAATVKYVSMKYYDKLTVLIVTGAIAAGDGAITLSQAKEVAGTTTKALSFTKMWSDETTSGTLAENTVTSDTFNLDTANKLYVIEIDSAQLDTSNDYDCVGVAVSAPSGNDYYSIAYVLSGTRFAQDVPLTAIAD